MFAKVESEVKTTVYRYYSTERPVAPGTFPKKGNFNIADYPQKVYINEIGSKAWGHIDYDEPLSDEDIRDYELAPSPSNPN